MNGTAAQKEKGVATVVPVTLITQEQRVAAAGNITSKMVDRYSANVDLMDAENKCAKELIRIGKALAAEPDKGKQAKLRAEYEQTINAFMEKLEKDFPYVINIGMKLDFDWKKIEKTVDSDGWYTIVDKGKLEEKITALVEKTVSNVVKSATNSYAQREKFLGQTPPEAPIEIGVPGAKDFNNDLLDAITAEVKPLLESKKIYVFTKSEEKIGDVATLTISAPGEFVAANEFTGKKKRLDLPEVVPRKVS